MENWILNYAYNYFQDFTLQNLERRCTHMQGESNTEEKTVLEAKIRQLQEELDKKTQTQQLLQLQLKRVQVWNCFILETLSLNIYI